MKRMDFRAKFGDVVLDESSFELGFNCTVDNINEAVEARKVFYRLGESRIFRYANENTKVNGEKLIDVIPKMVVSGQGFMQFKLDALEKTVMYELFESNTYKLSCKAQMRKLFDDGDVVMVFSEKYKVPTSIPFIIQGDGTKSKVFVNVTDFVDLDKFGKLVVTVSRNYNGLMAALFSACTACTILHKANTLPSSIADAIVMSYSSMVEKTLSSIIHADNTAREQVKYLATQFSLVQMYGSDQGIKLFQRYRDKYFPSLTNIIKDSMDNKFRLDKFDDLTGFLEELGEVVPIAKDITEYKMLEKWLRLYGPATTFSIDYLGYHLYTVIAVLFESPLISRTSLEPILEKNGGRELYEGLQRMIGT